MKKKRKLNEQIRLLRERADLSIQEAADALGIKYSRLVNWENGRNEPNLDSLLKMCEVYDVTADELLQTAQEYMLSLDEGKIIRVYRGMSEHLKELFMMITRAFEGYCKIERQSKKSSFSIPRPIYEQSASAGTGSFLDSSKYTMIEFPEDVVPHEATFGVRVSGNSMEPDYPDGSIVFVKQMKNLRPGDVGIFTLNGEGYIKELGDNTNLISRNKDYEDIIIKEYDDLRVIGKVVGEPYLEE